MRLPRESLLFLVLLTTLCLLGGMVFGIQSGKWASSPPHASPTAPSVTPSSTTPSTTSAIPAPFLQPSASAGQMAVMFVGVNDASAPQPKLEGCWIIAFTPGINQYYVLGIPPEATFHLASLGTDQTLAYIYNLDVQQEIGYHFMRDAIQSKLPGMSIQADVTLDRAIFTDLASKVGGISVGGHSLMGDALTVAYDTEAFHGSAARMAFQQQAAAALIQALANQGWSPATVAAHLEQLPYAVRPGDSPALTQLANSAPLLSSEISWNVVGNGHAAATVP